jgi:hypothetical protein
MKRAEESEMSAALIEAPELGRPTTGRPAAPVRALRSVPTEEREGRPGRGSARAVRPVGRSATGVTAPKLRQPHVQARSCRVDATARPLPAVAQAAWRLTNRGIAVIMITGAMLVAAALTVITATAVTVTAEDYRPDQSALAGR